MRRESFEHFYLTKVALGEGCGCAEHVTRIREIDSICGEPRPRTPWPTNVVPPFLALLARLFRRRAKEA